MVKHNWKNKGFSTLTFIAGITGLFDIFIYATININSELGDSVTLLTY